jgi:hypothetical protein
MERMKLDPEELVVATFDASLAPLASVPAETDPDTWEDTCIKMCPTDDTCTMLGCTRAVAL